MGGRGKGGKGLGKGGSLSNKRQRTYMEKMNEEENSSVGFTPKDKLINRAIGVGLIVFGIYLLYGLFDKKNE